MKPPKVELIIDPLMTTVGRSDASRDFSIYPELANIVEAIPPPEEELEIPEQVLKNVEAITNHQERYQQQATAAQKGLEKIVSIFGQPEFLYFQVVFFAIWEFCGHLVDLGVLPATFPQFDLREQWLDLASLFISTGVLVYEKRQEKLSEERSHLMLQLNLVTEQKIAKLISLVEELRVDLPNVRNRHDVEAELMKQATDPQVILEAIQQISEPSPSAPLEDTNI
jgi:uncharacterized membrane protein